VDQVQVHILDAELLQARADRVLDVAAVVLGREEELVPAEPGLLDRGADALLVTIDSLQTDA
jgi:hypothetical protein